jgi:hypothetical protein
MQRIKIESSNDWFARRHCDCHREIRGEVSAARTSTDTSQRTRLLLAKGQRPSLPQLCTDKPHNFAQRQLASIHVACDAVNVFLSVPEKDPERASRTLIDMHQQMIAFISCAVR